MKLDAAIILSAGFGTRMGEIGKLLPKPLWPIFEKKIIDLQIEFCLSKGINKIYINTHHKHDLIQAHLKKYPYVKILHEDPILDSGGAIHNLKKNSDVKKVLYLAGDQFYFFEQSLWDEGLQLLDFHPAVLFSMDAKGTDHYREFILKDQKLLDIKDHTSNEAYQTFSGLGFLNLEKIPYWEGVSKFFESVVNYSKETISVLHPVEQTYWDFGTTELYFNNCFRCLNEKDPFTEFIQKVGVFNEQKKNNDCYNSSMSGVVNLGSSVQVKSRPIIRMDDSPFNDQGPGLYYQDIYQEVSF